jgi:hypothetical protein
MAVRNTRTGGARKRVAGETKKGGKTTPATKPAIRQPASMIKKMQEKSGPKPTTKDSEAISRRRPDVINEPQSRPKTPTSKEPATKPAVKKPVPSKQRPDNYNQQQISRKANYNKGTGSK